MYEKVPNDPNGQVNTMIKALEKVRLHGGLSSDTLNHFHPGFDDWCLLYTYKHTPTFIGICMILDMHALTHMLIFSL